MFIILKRFFRSKEEREAARLAFERKFAKSVRKVASGSRLQHMDDYTQHGNTSTLLHSIAVSYFSCRLAYKFHLSYSERELIRGALLHDYFLYDWHEKDGGHRLHGFRHPAFALYNASKDFSLNRKERNIIARHMFPLTVLPPRCLEAWIVCFVDKYCAFSETMGDGRIQWER